MSTLGSGLGSNALFGAQNQQFRNWAADGSNPTGSASVAQIALMALRAANPPQQSSNSSSGGSARIEATSQGRNSLGALLGSGLNLGGTDGTSDGTGTARSFFRDLKTLVSAVESGDTGTAQSAAQSLQATLDAIAPQSDTDTGSATDATVTTVTVEITDTSDTSDAGQTDSGASSFLADVKSLLAAVESGDADASKAAADKISEGFNTHSARGPFSSPLVDSDTAQSLVKDLTTLFSAVEAGDAETAQTAAASVQATLDNISAASSSSADSTDGPSSASDTSSGFMADLKNLLSAVQGGDMDAAKTAFDTFTSDVPHGHRPDGAQGAPPPGDAQQASSLVDGIAALFSAVSTGDTEAQGTAADSLQAMLDSLGASDSSDGTAQPADTSQEINSAFLSDLQDLLTAVKTGDTANSKLWSVLTAYKEEQAAAV